MKARKVALVTGGGRGIGAAVSRRLAADGFAVAVNYAHRAREATDVVEEIEAAGGRAVALRADVSDADQAGDLVARTAELLGPVAVLVNNAGVSAAGSARSLPPGQWDRVLGVNLSGAYYCTHAALPAMYAAGWGRVLFFGSPSGGRALTPTTGAYAASKAGLVALAGVVAKEVARRGITVNTVVPGYVETDMVRAAGDRARESLQDGWPRIPAEAVASVVSFLAGDGAAHVSGEEIGVWAGGPVQL
ncbi:SDR family NAD(P)-dependent oxidoreductase [Streptomyces cathayae]|uniref:SDR family NAD(P)-dependent oxidoreductase n=2 Tax=Streptomyces TaxID=1883 RepID=A0ABW1DY93_9ACTN|nr:SDR family NAD(P)-dependent oxidoreductase [Streptomyces sp. HUAS 5]WGD44435.1 SDR family NAD(P)-dependent oxidoreductase [Streptomyces sp. HUAS 5]